MNKLVLTEPRIAFACLVVGPQREGPRVQVGVAEETIAVGAESAKDEGFLAYEDKDGVSVTGVMYDAIVLQLGSFFRYSLYRPANMPLVKGDRRDICGSLILFMQPPVQISFEYLDSVLFLSQLTWNMAYDLQAS